MIMLLFIIKLVSSEIQTTKIFGTSDSEYYYMNLYVGEPPILQQLIVSTGTSQTAIPCRSNWICDQSVNDIYNLKISYSNNVVNCTTMQKKHYCSRCQEHQCKIDFQNTNQRLVEGYLVSDRILFGDQQFLNRTNVGTYSFLCASRQINHKMNKVASGILGLAPSNKGHPNIIDQISKQQNISSFFSICIGRWDGYFSIGGQKILNDQVSTNFTIKYINNFQVSLTEISQQNQFETSFLELEMIFPQIDSSLPYTYFKQDIAQWLNDHFQCYGIQCIKTRGSQNLQCYIYNSSIQTLEQFAGQFSVLTFSFNGKFFRWGPENYLVRDYVQKDVYCFPVVQLEGDYPHEVILGQAFMRNWNLGFDLENRTITFIQNNCSYQNERLDLSVAYDRPKACTFTSREVYNIIIPTVIITIALIVVIIALWYYFRRRNQLKSNKKQKLSIQIEPIEHYAEAKAFEMQGM